MTRNPVIASTRCDHDDTSLHVHGREFPRSMNRSPSYVFDLDGTISDPIVGIARSLNYALESFGHPIIADAQVARFVGPPLDQSFRSIVGPVAHEHVVALVSKYRERYADIGFSENVLYPGILETLRHLAAAGVQLGLCTSKPEGLAEKILCHFGIRDHFRFISGGDIGVSKVDQLASLIEQDLIGLPSCMIGDRAIDIVAAKSNRLTSVGALWGYGSLEELHAAFPDLLLSSPCQLVDHRP